MADLVKLRSSHDHRESQLRGATELEACSTREGFFLLMEHCPTDHEKDIVGQEVPRSQVNDRERSMECASTKCQRISELRLPKVLTNYAQRIGTSLRV